MISAVFFYVHLGSIPLWGGIVFAALNVVMTTLLIVQLSRDNSKDAASPGATSGLAPAWYSDPDDSSRLRYWDGSRWTEHRAPRTRTAPTGTKWPVWVGLGAAAFGLVVLAGLGVLLAIGFWASHSAIEDSAELQVGDCLTDLEGSIVNNPPLIDCALPHRAEAIAKIALPAGPYPGRDEVPALASAACRTQFKLFVGRTLESSELNQFILWPIEATWETNRQVTCIVFDYADVTGTLKGANR